MVSPFDAEPGGQVGSVSVCDVGVLPQEHGDLLIGVEPDAPGHQHRPVLVTSQLDVVGSLAILLLFLRHRCAAVCRGQTCRDIINTEMQNNELKLLEDFD